MWIQSTVSSSVKSVKLTEVATQTFVEENDNSKSYVAYNLLCLNTNPNIFVRAFSSGNFDILVSSDEVEPKWKVDIGRDNLFLEISLFDEFALNLSKPSRLIVTPDPLYRDRFYIHHKFVIWTTFSKCTMTSRTFNFILQQIVMVSSVSFWHGWRNWQLFWRKTKIMKTISMSKYQNWRSKANDK